MKSTQLVVVNCVFNLFPTIPCTPRLALIKARHTKDSVFVQVGSARASATPGWPLLNIVTAAAMVMRTWRNVARINHMRLCAPMRSPIRPTNAPALNDSNDVKACRSAMWNVSSLCPGGPSNNRASASASLERMSHYYLQQGIGRLTCAKLPVWNPHHTNTAENEIASLWAAGHD